MGEEDSHHNPYSPGLIWSYSNLGMCQNLLEQGFTLFLILF